MSIGNITQSVSIIPAPPHRGVDVQTVFVTKQEDFQDHLAGTTIDELNTLKDQLNTRIGEINSTVTTMSGYADTASAGASTATTKAEEASTSASGALTSRNQAETFKNNASASATKASQWADNNYNVEVEVGKYSAKHWSVVAENATSGKIDKVTSTDNAIVRFNGTTGQVQNSAITIDDNGNMGSGAQSFNGFGGTGFKNYIINGDMRVDQRNSGSQVIDSSGLSNYVLDRWQLITRAGATILSGRNESEYTKSSTGCAYYNGITINSQKTTASTDQFRLVQSIEAQNINDFKFGTVSAENITLSFWVNHSIAGTYSGAILGANGGTYISYVFTYVQNTANEWEKKTINISGCQTGTWAIGNTSGLSVCFDYGSGSAFQTSTLNTWLSGVYLRSSSSLSPVSTNGAILRFTGVQLEKGSIATPFEQRPIGLELSLCQRYYERLINFRYVTYMSAGNNAWISSKFSVPKRIAPTMNTVSATYTNTTGIAYYDVNTGHVNIACNATALGQVGFLATIEASAEL